MKVRTGFVSNSSSSSFLICHKGDLTKKKLLETFGIVPGSAAEKFLNPLMTKLLGNPHYTEESILSNYGCESREQAKESSETHCLKLLKLLDDGWQLARLHVENSEDLLIEMLDNEVKTSDFKITREY